MLTIMDVSVFSFALKIGSKFQVFRSMLPPQVLPERYGAIALLLKFRRMGEYVLWLKEKDLS